MMDRVSTCVRAVFSFPAICLCTLLWKWDLILISLCTGRGWALSFLLLRRPPDHTNTHMHTEWLTDLSSLLTISRLALLGASWLHIVASPKAYVSPLLQADLFHKHCWFQLVCLDLCSCWWRLFDHRGDMTLLFFWPCVKLHVWHKMKGEYFCCPLAVKPWRYSIYTV